MSTALVSRDQILSGLKKVKRSVKENVATSMPLLNITKTGRLCFGQNKTRIKKDEIWACRPESLMHGYIAWHNGQPEKEIMVPAHKDLPDLDNLPKVQAEKGYEFQTSVIFVATKGDNAGTEILLKKATKGACDLVEAVVDEVMDAAEAGEKVIPVGRLWVDSYHHKKFGETFTPEFEIQKWMTAKALEKLLAKLAEEDEADEAASEKKARNTRKAAKEEDEDEEDEDDSPEERSEDPEDDDDDDSDDTDDDDDDDDDEDGEDEPGDGPDGDDDDDDDEGVEDGSDDDDDEDDGKEDKPKATPRRRVHRR